MCFFDKRFSSDKDGKKPIIRFAERSDIQALAALDKHISEEELKRVIDSRRIIAAETDGIIAGWLRFGLFWDEIPFMNMLFVVEEERGKGCGAALCDFWENEMRSRCCKYVLTSTLSNEQAQHFYRKRGYKDCGSLILPGEPLEIILLKELNSNER